MEVRFEVTYADQSPGTATVETSLNGAWEREYLRDPITGLFQEAAEADVVTDGEALLKLGIGVEGLLRREVAHQYVGWPPESTTDGSVANLCRRISPDVIEAMGFTCLDFGPAVFPFRVVATRNAADGLTVVIAIGVELPGFCGHGVMADQAARPAA